MTKGACMVRGCVCGEGVCVRKGGHVWQRGGVYGKGGHA